MVKKIVFALLVSLASATMSIGADSATPGQRLQERIKAANAKIKTIDNQTLRIWIESSEQEFVLLDVREPGEVSAGQIEADDTMSIPRGLVEMQFTKKVTDLETPVVIYCLQGSRGALAAEALTDLGYTNIYNLQGGLLAWIEGGHPVSNFFGEFEMKNFESNFPKKS